MKNVFITGSGRSGTSMLAGAFRLTPAYLGARLHPPRPANPKGFFEDAEVNDINEAIIAEGLTRLAGEADAEEIKSALPHGQLWLASLPGMFPPTENRGLQKRIAAQTASGPFCFKDPRFSSTLSSWQPYAAECAILVIFRDPVTTVESTLKECRTAPYLRDLALSVDDAMAVWRQCYCRLLELYLVHRNICFVPYDHVLDGSAITLLEDLVGCELDRSFPTPELSRTRSSLPPDELCTAVHQVLQEVSAEDLGLALTTERQKAVAELVRRVATCEKADKGRAQRAYGTHGLANRVAVIRERQLQGMSRDLMAAKQRIEELRDAEAEREESSAAADAWHRKLLTIDAQVGELRQENARLRQELAFKRANLDQLVGTADALDHLNRELERARGMQRQHAETERRLNERCYGVRAVADVDARKLAQAGEELSRLRQEAVERERELTAWQAVAKALGAEKEAALRDLEARQAGRLLRRTLSWRLTKRLRSLLPGR